MELNFFVLGEFYAFIPSEECELFSGALNSFVYFIFSRKHKRMILVSGSTER
jgi:hypothetical protein